MGFALPIFAENSLDLLEAYVAAPKADKTQKFLNEFFESLKNISNVKILKFTRTALMEITSLSEYLKYEMPNVEELYLSGLSNDKCLLQNLDGIENFTNLKKLEVKYNSKILDISAIKNCKNLTDIDLKYSNVKSVLGLEGLNNLQKLTLNNNNISSLKPLENLKNLEELNLSNNTISDTSSYIDSDGSTKTYNNLEILANLNKNGKLKKLYLAGNDNIINWSPLSSLKWTDKSGW